MITSIIGIYLIGILLTIFIVGYLNGLSRSPAGWVDLIFILVWPVTWLFLGFWIVVCGLGWLYDIAHGLGEKAP